MAGQQQGGVDPTKNYTNPPPFYGTFPDPAPPAQYPPPQALPPPHHVVQVGYQSYVYPVVAEGVPVILQRTTYPLPCCGIGLGWALFLAGFFFAAIPWYVGTFILFFVAIDYREKAGLVACTVAATLAAIAAILGMSNSHPPW